MKKEEWNGCRGKKEKAEINIVSYWVIAYSAQTNFTERLLNYKWIWDILSKWETNSLNT